MDKLIDKLREAVFTPSLQAQQAKENWFKNYPQEQGWKQNPDGSYDVKGDVIISRKSLTKIPWKFRRVGGSFFCSNNQLTTLEGAPQRVGGIFYCNRNQLTTLEGAPKRVGVSFYCGNNQLTSLKGAPQHVGGNFFCDNNPVPSQRLKTTVKRSYLQK